jgi:A/G-specific adenine glycosylase
VAVAGDLTAIGAGVGVEVGAVLAWGGRQLRDLPWRRTRDPWAVLVSEVMAQQTGVDRVVPYYEAFLARFPDPPTCAAAPAGAVLTLWSGLGYNRRAVHLHACARAITTRHGGRVPDDLDALLALPGIGPYTARAVLAFAFERPVGVVDTNVGRVLARWSGRSLRPAEAQAAADARATAAAGGAAGGPAWLWNQAVMELGARVCTRRAPDCTRCPVAGGCAWGRAGQPAPDPADGSAGVGTGQPRFEGSDRQGRGRLVNALRYGPVKREVLAQVMGWPDDEARAERVAQSVVADGLAERRGTTLRLPGGS